MPRYTIVDAAGCIIGRADLPAKALAAQRGRTFIEGDAPSRAHRWDGQKWTAPPAAAELQQARDAKLAALAREHAHRHLNPVALEGVSYPADLRTVAIVACAASAAAIDPKFVLPLPDTEGTVRLLGVASIASLARAYAVRTGGLHLAHENLKKAVLAAPSTTRISAIQWETHHS